MSLQQAELPTPDAVLQELDALLLEFLRDGLSGSPGGWLARLKRVEKTLRSEGLTWLAELSVELIRQQEMYTGHDALCEPELAVKLIGELSTRSRAVSRGLRAVPQALIRGSKSDRATDIAGGRMIGVGLGVRPGPRHVTLSAYLQDADTGSVAAVERAFADPDAASGDQPRSFVDLASTVLSRGVTLGSLAGSQLLLKSGKRTASGVLTLPRTAGSLSVNPQGFQWEQLKPPFAAEDFEQLAARFASLPPSYLRPRRRTENLHAVPLHSVTDPAFDSAKQRVTATLHDVHGRTVRLVHAYHARGHEGFEGLLAALKERREQTRFVCGHFRLLAGELEVQPVCLVLETAGRRIGVLPWLGEAAQMVEADASTDRGTEEEPAPVDQFFEQFQEELAELMVTGAGRCEANRWSELADLGRRLGFNRLANAIAKLADELTAKSNALRWDATKAVAAVRELCLLLLVAHESR